MFGNLQSDQNKLKRIFIESVLPEPLQPLQKIANNIWWSWNSDAIELFRSLQPDQWENLGYNPIAVMDTLTFERANQLRHGPKVYGAIE